VGPSAWNPAPLSASPPCPPPLGRAHKAPARATACWSGYIATYVVKYGDLLLRDLGCWIDPDSPPPSIGGHLPADANEWGELAYVKLEIPMPYTGQLILGGGEILGSFSYGLDWSIYELVHELRFEQGHLVEAIDLSSEAAQRRSPTVWDWDTGAFLIRPNRVPSLVRATLGTPSLQGFGGFAPPSTRVREARYVARYCR
jgi:hypothetical protein